MTCIAWDGRTLAVDSQASCDGRKKIVVKLLLPVQGGLAIAWCGDHEQGLALAQWYLDGAKPEVYPAFQTKDAYTELVVAFDGRRCVHYEVLPIAQEVTEPFAAWGSGASIAIGAMAVGASARSAVAAACRFNIWCGEPVRSTDWDTSAISSV